MTDKCEMCGKEFGHKGSNRKHRHHLLPRWMEFDAGFIDFCTGCHTKVESRLKRFLAGYETNPIHWKQYQDDNWKTQMKERHKNEKRKFLFVIEFPGGVYQVSCSATNPKYSPFVGTSGGLTLKPSKRWTPDKETQCYYIQVKKSTAIRKPLMTQDEADKEGEHENK